MNTQEVIDTISRATNDLFVTLRQQDEAIKQHEADVVRLEARISVLEGMLADSRSAHSESRDYADKSISDLRASLASMTAERDLAVQAQNKLKDIILNVAATVDSVVNPPAAVTAQPPRPVLVDDKGLPHDPETGKFVEVPKHTEVRESVVERPLATGTEGYRPYWER